MNDAIDIRNYIKDHLTTVDGVYSHCISSILEAAELIKESFDNGHKLLLCGNGGSAADCQHMAAELVASVYPAISLTTDTSVLTAISNDRCYDDVFADQVAALGDDGDVLMVISTSGKSENVLMAVADASIVGLKIVALTGEKGLDAEFAHVSIKVPSTNTQHIQEAHIMILHILWRLICSE